MKKLAEGTIIYFKISETEKGFGTICGFVHELPAENIVMYIVELGKRESDGIKAYPYSCIVLPDSCFEPLHR